MGRVVSADKSQVSLCNALSLAVIPRGGIPQGTKLAPILFAVLVNKLTSTWNLRAKYVDDLTIVQIIQRYSLRLNGRKDMLIEFLKYTPFLTTPI